MFVGKMNPSIIFALLFNVAKKFLLSLIRKNKYLGGGEGVLDFCVPTDASKK